jgi:cytochrome c peroxidase
MQLRFLSWWGLNKTACILLLGISSCRQSDTTPNPFARIPAPGQNPTTTAGVALGKALFFSPLLSGNQKMSCATCHQPENGFSSARKIVSDSTPKRPAREIPHLYNLAWSPTLFWDGREQNLESLVLKPVQDHREMNLSLKSLLKRVNKDPVLTRLGKEAFETDTLGTQHLARALSQYLRTLQSRPTAHEGLGKVLFDRHCSACHPAPFYTDFVLRKSVLAASGLDSGRFWISSRPDDVFVFKTPGLNKLAKTGPYMHDGRLKTLEEVVRQYARKLPAPGLLQPDSAAALQQFLNAL